MQLNLRGSLQNRNQLGNIDGKDQKATPRKLPKQDIIPQSKTPAQPLPEAPKNLKEKKCPKLNKIVQRKQLKRQEQVKKWTKIYNINNFKNESKQENAALKVYQRKLSLHEERM